MPRKKLQSLPEYKRLNNRFLSCRGWPSHTVVGSRSFACFLMSPQRTTFIEPKGCPCASSSTRFFMAVLPPPFHVGSGYDVSIASLFSLSESSSVPECVAYPQLQQPHSTIKQTLGAHICNNPWCSTLRPVTIFLYHIPSPGCHGQRQANEQRPWMLSTEQRPRSPLIVCHIELRHN